VWKRCAYFFFYMAKIKIERSFSQTPNDLLNNKNISLKAKGLFGFINSKPDDWDFTVEKIASQCKENTAAVRSAIVELESAGYLFRRKFQKEDSRWDIEYYLFEFPTFDFRTFENRTCENRTIGKPTNNSKTELTKTDNKKEIDVDEKEKIQPFVENARQKIRMQIVEMDQDFFAFTMADENFLSLVAKNHFLSDIDNVKRLLKIFNGQYVRVLKEWKSITDFRKHFESWLKLTKDNYPDLKKTALEKTSEKIRSWIKSSPNEIHEIFPPGLGNEEKSNLIKEFVREGLSGETAKEFSERPVVAIKNYFKQYCESQLKTIK